MIHEHSVEGNIVKKYGTYLKLGLLLLFLGSAIYYFRFTESGRQIQAKTVLQQLKDAPHGRLTYVAIYIVGTVLLLPGTALSFAGAVLFGTLEGTLYTWIGATTGSCLAFLISKALGRDFVNQLFGGKFEAFEKNIRAHGFQGLLIIRLLPIFPFNGVNFGCGLTTIRFRDYLLATAIGILPGTFMYQYLFATFGETIIEEGVQWKHLADPQLLGALAVFVVFLVMVKLFTNRLKPVNPTNTQPG